MKITEYIILAIALIVFFFPLVFAFYKNVSNKLLFIVSVIGTFVLANTLLWVISSPFSLFLFKIFPELTHQAAQQGKILNPILLSIAYTAEFVSNRWWQVVFPLLLLSLPVALHRRYSIFHLTSGSIDGTAQCAAP